VLFRSHPVMNIEEAIDYLGLSAVKPFDPMTNIIEYNLGIVY